MQFPDQAWLIEIDITNVCINKCSHCSRLIGHQTNPFFMSLENIEKALISLQGWKKGVGCMGGEPTLHPEFEKICGLFQKYFPKGQCCLLTAGGERFEKFKPLIEETFGIINYNDHQGEVFHQPPLVAISEVLSNSKQIEKLIDQCWLNHLWSPSISERGVFFCEMAASLDELYDCQLGISVEDKWWQANKRDQFLKQRELCYRCGMALPLAKISHHSHLEYMTQNNFEALASKNSPLIKQGRVEVIKSINSINQSWGQEYYAKKGKHFWFRAPIKIHLLIAYKKVFYFFKTMIKRLF